MKITKSLIITIENQNDFKELTECGNVYIRQNAKFTAPNLTTTGNVDISENAKFTAPNLTTTGYVDISENAKFTAPNLTTTGYVYIRQNAKFTAPNLTTTGNVYIRQNAKFTAPNLTTTGYVYIRQNAKFTAKFLKNKKYLSVDNSLFIIENEKSSKGIKIYTGYVVNSVDKNKINKSDCFVSFKDGLYSHGLTVKKSIQDLQFKIVSEKLKNEPIKAETIIDIKYYRLITGACEFGCQSFIQQNNLIKESYRADELYPILKSKNAYGIEKFESLIDFK